MNTTASILVVDDDPAMTQLLTLMLKRAGYKVYSATSGAQALTLLSYQPIDILLTDYSMPDMNGADLIRETRKTHPGLLIYILTAYSADYLANEDPMEGVQAVLSKPLQLHPFLNRLSAALDTHTQCEVCP